MSPRPRRARRRMMPAMLLALAACTVGPDYRPPSTALPATWDAIPLVSPEGVGRDEAWWDQFNDPWLGELIGWALTSNYDLERAEGAVREARAARARTAAGLFPTLDGTGSYQRSRRSETLTTTSSFPGGGSTGVIDDNFQSGFDASWEPDLFGRVRRGIESAEAGVEAARAAADGVRLTLIGDVARAYVDARGLQQRIAVVGEQVRSQRDTLDITRAKFQAGTGTGLDVVRAEAELANTEAQLPPLQSALKADIYRLSVLTGRDPAALVPVMTLPRPIPVASEPLKVGVPADLIRRRPDIVNAERQVAQANANIGVAEADRYPVLTVNGTIGLGSRTLSNFAKPESLVWSVGPQLDVPILDGGRRRAEVAVQQARTDQALAQYQTTVLAALEEVENALTAYANEEERRQALIRAAANARDALALAQELYVRGLSPFLDVLVAQRSLFQTEIELAISEAAVSTDLVAIYKALGGGWDVMPKY